MTMQLSEWFRTRLACYGAAIAIILEQLNAAPRTTVIENPNPLVRVQPSGHDLDDWHPDEVIRAENGTSWVVVWTHSTESQSEPGRLMSAN